MANLKDFFRDLLNWEKQHTYGTMDKILFACHLKLL